MAHEILNESEPLEINLQFGIDYPADGDPVEQEPDFEQGTYPFDAYYKDEGQDPEYYSEMLD